MRLRFSGSSIVPNGILEGILVVNSIFVEGILVNDAILNAILHAVLYGILDGTFVEGILDSVSYG